MTECAARASRSRRSSTTRAARRPGAGPCRRRRRGARARERAPRGRAARQGRRAARLPRTDRRGRRRGSAAGSSATSTTAPSSGWCRWRSTLRLAREQARRDPRRPASCSTRVGEELDEALERAARARPRHPPGGAHRPRPRAGARGARRPRAAAGRADDVARRAAAGDRVEAAAYFVVAEALTNVAKYAASARERRGQRRARQRRASTVEVSDDGVGGADAGRRHRACAASPTASRRSTGGSTCEPGRATAPPCARGSRARSRRRRLGAAARGHRAAARGGRLRGRRRRPATRTT